MSRDDKGKVVDIGQAIKNLKDEIPPDMAKLAVWRKGLQAPTTFVVQEDVGREVQADFLSMVNQGTAGALSFETYNDGGGRRSHTYFDVEDIVGLTLEFAVLALATS